MVITKTSAGSRYQNNEILKITNGYLYSYIPTQLKIFNLICLIVFLLIYFLNFKLEILYRIYKENYADQNVCKPTISIATS